MIATRLFTALSLATLIAGPSIAEAGPSAATFCPPFGFLNTTNHADNPSFETVGENGNPSICQAPCVAAQESAADEWTIHSSNQGDKVVTRLEPLSVLDPRQVPYGTGPKALRRMLHIIPNGNEGGVFQRHFDTPSGTKVMFQAWVYVKKGRVVIQSNGGTTGPAAWSTKHNQWEELRTCTDGTVPVDLFVIYNQDRAGGDFFVDRAEIREIP